MKPSVGPAAEAGTQLAVAVVSSSDKLPLQLNTATNKESRSSVWLEHYTDNVGVSSSNLLGTTEYSIWRLAQQLIRRETPDNESREESHQILGD